MTADQTLDPITVEVIGNALSTVVEEMGRALMRASYSANIKERRDCSAAIFDTEGNVIAQAQQIPLHFGSLLGILQETVKRTDMSQLRPGDVFIGNRAQELRGLLKIKYPLEHGIVTDWDDMERIWQYIYTDELKTLSEEVCVD